MAHEERAQAAAVSNSFYKRKLPCPPAIAFSSSEGKRLFAEALADGTMEGFFSLVEQFCTQDEPAFCGLASLAMVLNTLSIDPKRPWKGPWRWFHELMLDCCKPMSEIKKEGIILDQAACLARCNGAEVEMLRHPEISLEAFRKDIAQACHSQHQHLIVSYCRKAFKQTGDGHFSPIGGYHAGDDVVLILDVARFKYPPHWVPLALLHEAMGYEDPATKKPRGYLRIGACRQPSSALFSLDIHNPHWKEAKEALDQAPQLFASAEIASSAVTEFCSGTSSRSVAELISIRQMEPMGCCADGAMACVQPDIVKQLMSEVRGTQLCTLLAKEMGAENQNLQLFLERVTISLLMVAAVQCYQDTKDGQYGLLSCSHKDQVLEQEVAFLAAQYREMPALQASHSITAASCSCKSSTS